MAMWRKVIGKDNALDGRASCGTILLSRACEKNSVNMDLL